MPATIPDSSSPRPHSAPRCDPELGASWQRVEVTSAQISRAVGVDCARAVIQLGGLTPADVRVELVPADPSLAETAPSARRRMFSSYPYDNGCFVFEASLSPRDTAKVRDWLIQVHLRDAGDLSPVIYRVRTSA